MSSDPPPLPLQEDLISPNSTSLSTFQPAPSIPSTSTSFTVGASFNMNTKPTYPLSPSNSSPFIFACACLNVRIEARVPIQVAQTLADSSTSPSESTQSGSSTLLQPIWLPANSEKSRLPGFVSYDLEPSSDSWPDAESGTINGGERIGQNDTNAPVSAWRTCWICKVKCYRVTGVTGPDASPSQESWVDIDFSSGLLYGDALESALKISGLPFSSLLVDAPSTSNFGRPPSSTTPNIYDDITLPALLPPLPDPFFLPPPFVPSHPKLLELCKEAVESLQVDHHRIEGEIRHYISQRAGEMKSLEDKVRAEVEVLWTRYCEGPGKEEIALERRRSTSQARSSGAGGDSARRTSVSTRDFPTAQVSGRIRTSQPLQVDRSSRTVDLSLSQQSIGGANTASTSLLSASISANAFQAPPPPSKSRREPNPTTPDVFNQLERLSMDEKGVDREVAMSYVFSSMDQHLGGPNRQDQAVLLDSGAVSARPDPVLENQFEVQPGLEGTVDGEEIGKEHDSWIGMERRSVDQAISKELERVAVADSSISAPVVDGESEFGIADEGRTPRPRQVKELNEAREGKKPARVKFEEPPKEAKVKDKGSRLVSAEGRDAVDDVEEDYVFDFDMDDMPAAIDGSGGGDNAKIGSTSFNSVVPSSPPTHSAERRPRNIVETNLSRTFAADAPSHRAAWRRIERDGSMMTALRRKSSLTTPDDDDDDDEDFQYAVPGGRRGSEDQDGGLRSNLAMSMPVAIVRPRQSADGRIMSAALPPLERKTSLTDERGILVPPLIRAMRERPSASSPAAASSGESGGGAGIHPDKATRSQSSTLRGGGVSLVTRLESDIGGGTVTSVGGGDENTVGSGAIRSTSTSREREQVQAYTLDPGAVFESLADGDDEEGGRHGGGDRRKKREVSVVDGLDEGVEDGGGSGDGGNGRKGAGTGLGVGGARAFVPPHEIARRESADRPEVGWRSLVS